MKFVIGDIHGEISKLEKLLINIIEIDVYPELIFIGDYLDKGESARETLDYLIKLKLEHRCVFLEGNHEYQWLNLGIDINLKNYLLNYGGLMTMNSFDNIKDVLQMKDVLLDEYKEFFLELVPYWENENYVITHSGIPPKYYGNQLVDIEKKDLLFNRYDFIKAEMKYKDKVVIFGHTAFYEPYYDGFKIGLDTAACYIKTQPLTSFCIDQEFFVCSNNKIINLIDLNINQCPNIVRVKPWRI